MRKGYWNIVLRGLRQKLAEGVDTLSFEGVSYTIETVTDADEPSPDGGGNICFAADSGGNRYVVNLDRGQVEFVSGTSDLRVTLSPDLRAFVDALEPRVMPWP